MITKLIKTIKIGEYDINFYSDGSINMEGTDYGDSNISFTKEDIKQINKELAKINETA